MKLFPSGWLYNAGAVGMGRILSWGRGDDELYLDLFEKGISPDLLEHYSLYYWTYAAKVFLPDVLNSSDLRKAMDKILGSENRDWINKLKTRVKSIEMPPLEKDRYSTYKKFVLEVDERFRSWFDELKEYALSLDEKPRNLKKYLDSVRGVLDGIIRDLLSLKLQMDALGRFYFNKNVLNNPPGTYPKNAITYGFLNRVSRVSGKGLKESLAKKLFETDESLDDIEKWLAESLYSAPQEQRDRIMQLWDEFKSDENLMKMLEYARRGEDPVRIEKFHTTYVEPAMELLEGKMACGDDSHGCYVCSFCGGEYRITSSWNEKMIPFVEGDFSPIGVSIEQFPNFFFDGQAPHKCPVCQLVILSAFAGFNRKPYLLQEIERMDYIYIDLPDLMEAYRVNQDFSGELENLSEGILQENIYYRGIEIVIQNLKEKSRWVLDNILFVELKPVSQKRTGKPGFSYFNIDRGAALVFAHLDEKNYLKWYLGSLNKRYGGMYSDTIHLSTQAIRDIVNKKSLKPLIFAYFKDYLAGNHGNLEGVWSMVAMEHLINETRKALKEKGGFAVNGVNVVERIHKNLWGLRRAGERTFTLSEMDLDKRRRLAQRFLTLIRGGRKEEFYSEVLRLHVVYEKEVPNIVFSLLSEDEHLTFQEKALAWLTGFVSPTSTGERKAEEKEENKEVSNEA